MNHLKVAVVAAALLLSAVSFSSAVEPTDLQRAIQAGDLTKVEAILAAGADANAVDQNGATPLHVAATRFRADAAKRLIAAGANVETRNADGLTPLAQAANTGPDAPEVDLLLVDVARVLIAAGADVNAADNQGMTPLDHAIRRGHPNLISLLREHGADRGLHKPSDEADRDDWISYSAIGPRLLDVETNYPAIAKRYIIGQSYEGRNLWAIRISDNVGIEEDEPEFKYISTMHGDEILGVEMCLRLIDALTQEYATDPQIQNLVDEVDIWIVPLMNPDGYDQVSRERYSAEGFDLNRNFPEGAPPNPEPNSPAGRATETQVIMNWCFGESFTLSANFHGGALVVNYPFDNAGSESQYTPDQDMFVYISEEYSRHNLPMWNSPYFYHGITNGVDWYTTIGCMQDWNYRYMGCNAVTIEISDIKQPPYSQADTFWSQNRDSMLAYMDTCLIGIRGVVTDPVSGDPVAATVTVVGRDHDIFTDPDVGDYHRMLEPGTYDLRFDADGYDPLVIEDIVVDSGSATRVDVSLNPPPELVTPDGGETYMLGDLVTVTWAGSPTANYQVQYTPNFGDFSLTGDGFERTSLGSGYTTGGSANWFTTTSSAHSGVRSARAGAIGNNQNTWMESVAGGGTVSFWYRVDCGSGDYFEFFIDDSLKIQISGYRDWNQYQTTVAAGNHTLRWEYRKNGSGTGGSDTVWVDDLMMNVDNTTWYDIVAETDPGVTTVDWTPPTPSDAYKVRVRTVYGGGFGSWDESIGTFTVEDPGAAGDIDGDGDIDLVDFATFAYCYYGAAVTVPPVSCTAAQFETCDLDDDGDVDLSDFSTFAANYTG